MARRHATPARSAPIPFDRKLVLNQWMLSLLLGFASFDRLADQLKQRDLEGFTAEGFTRFLGVMLALPNRDATLSDDVLRGYDANIVRHWREIMARRTAQGNILTPKYFQYLALLFTEIYLDRYFTNADALCAALNAYVQSYNLDKDADADQVSPYAIEDLRKLAFWQATGSGKTFIMHINIRQYQHYLARAGRQHELNRIILITPNESLSRQHVREMALSGIDAALFNKEQRSFFEVDVLDINKLSDTSKVKTVSVEAFEGSNLVLVDEGHRGVGGDVWKLYRDALSKNGFALEYSATFGQAVNAASANNRKSLTQEYAHAILFDYSYRYFYKDGYGKEFQIFNLGKTWEDDTRYLYLTGALLAFYQQLSYYRDQRATIAPFQIEAPLWVFVGGNVTKEASDVLEIVRFFAHVTHPEHAPATIRRIEQLLSGTGTLMVDERDIFLNAFSYLQTLGQNANEHYEQILELVFNSKKRGVLNVTHLKQSGGEIALSVSTPDDLTQNAFGVINVGDAAKLMSNLQNEIAILEAREQEFENRSLFDTLDKNPHMTLLIGAKKFTEGWNSWRVSTMGLLNVGKGEGAQIIQLFGRGVRLQGYGFGLKRSTFVQKEQMVRVPPMLPLVETLQLFGIHADYIAQFRGYLEAEGVTERTTRTFTIPTQRLTPRPPLKMLVLKDGVDYRMSGEVAELSFESKIRPVTLDWYPKVALLASDGGSTVTQLTTNKETATVGTAQQAFINWTQLTFELQREKQERGWHRLVITPQSVRALFKQTSWYRLYLPRTLHTITRWEQSRYWQEIVTSLAKKYLEAFYKYKRAEYERPHLTYRLLSEDDPNWIDQYEVTVEQSETALANTLTDLKAKVEAGALATFGRFNLPVGALTITHFERHLYHPLLSLGKSGGAAAKVITISPVALEPSERAFVDDLRRLWESQQAWFADKELYLLRNRSKVGLGFFEARNFYPDFILWLVVNGHQYISVIDPKGLRQIQEGVDNDKLAFARTIKEIETRIREESGDNTVTLNSFIVTPTPYNDVQGWRDEQGTLLDRDSFANHHIFFQEEENAGYLRRLFKCLLPDTPLP